MANKKDGILYTGVTSNLIHRVWQHRNKQFEGFTKKYNVEKLVYFEMHQNMEYALVREKQIKKWNRKWKIELIEKEKIEWLDLWNKIQ